jgi:leader peptidase (prepilin peptidase) / N-methyltransferase
MELFLAFLFGTFFGFFLNVVILRIQEDESILFPTSHCLTCNKPLKPWHKIPFFSWIFLKGKCEFCKAPISTQYPLIEFISGTIFFIIALKLGITLSAFFTALTFSMLLALSIIDFRYKIAPNSLNLLAILFALLSAYSFPIFIQNFKNALLFAGGFTLLRFSLSYILTTSMHIKAKKIQTSWNKNYHLYPFIEAMGEADIMVAATMGALLGLQFGLIAIFFAVLLTLPVMLYTQGKSQEKQQVPFIPFLSMGTLISYLLDSQIYTYLDSLYA